MHANNVPTCSPTFSPTFTANPNFAANPTFTPQYNNSPIYNTEINPQFITTTTSIINAVGMQVRDIMLYGMDKAQKTFTKDNYESAKKIIKQLMWDYRYKISACTVLGIYGIISLLLLADYHYLNNSARWSRWKSDYSFAHLCEMPQTELTQELLCAIGEYHFNKKNPTDLSHPLITFIATIEVEIKTCKRYLRIAKIIKRLHLSTLLPTDDCKIDTVTQFHQRALFIKHIFLSWLAERNLATKAIKKNCSRLLLNKNYHYAQLIV